MSNGKGPKIKPRGGEKKLKDSKNKVLINKAYELARSRKSEGRLDTKDLIQSLNAVKGVEISKGVSASVLKGVANKIANVIPVAGVAGKKNKD
jgi:hypothetical protein|tara:strand:+ start:136 stop:414 length:279 start_codon:yes stop_codon:yes gene_type:complete